MQIKPDPVAKKEYFSKTFCADDSVPPKKQTESTTESNDSDSDSSDDEE